jgi:hypothetical protein
MLLVIVRSAATAVSPDLHPRAATSSKREKYSTWSIGKPLIEGVCLNRHIEKADREYYLVFRSLGKKKRRR